MEDLQEWLDELQDSLNLQLDLDSTQNGINAGRQNRNKNQHSVNANGAGLFGNVDWNNVASGGINILNGAMTIGNNAWNASRTQDTPQFDTQVNTLNTIGNSNYKSQTQILNGYQNMGYMPVQKFDDVRGMTKGQKLANVGSSLISGASAGAAVGGLPGAIVGGLVGIGSSLIGIKEGDKNAELKVREDNMLAREARNNAYMNLASQTEDVRKDQFRNAYANRGAYGGKIERKQMDIKDFANRVMNRPTPRVVRTKCKGGVMIKINK